MTSEKATSHDPIYTERLSSPRTQALFIALTLLFGVLLAWRVTARGLDGLAIAFLCLSSLFLFYTVNYRTLSITLTAQALKLKFGLFSWTIPLGNITNCQPDQNIPAYKRNGGAGIHFMSVGGRYRASFNFLEYPRLVIAFKRKAGPVVDISFSTRQPEELIRLIQAAAPASAQG